METLTCNLSPKGKRAKGFNTDGRHLRNPIVPKTEKERIKKTLKKNGSLSDYKKNYKKKPLSKEDELMRKACLMG